MKTHDSFGTANAATILSLILSLGAGISCASGGDGTGSESHFACKKDEDCARLGVSLVCIDAECVEADTDGTGGGPSGALAIEPACGAYSLGARLEAGELFVAVTEQLRKQLTDACAALSGRDAPESPTDADATLLCRAARASLATMLGDDAVISYAVEPKRVDAEAQFACENGALATSGCSCEPSTLETRCPSDSQETQCTGSCTGECFSGPGMCQGECTGLCEGRCGGVCQVQSGPDCAGECEGVCTGTCTGSCRVSAAAICPGTCVGECSASAGIAGCATLTPAPCSCGDASDAYPACEAIGILRGRSGATRLWRAGSEYQSADLLSVHEVLRGAQLAMLAAESALPALPRTEDLPASCAAEVGPRLTALIARAAEADATLRVLLTAATDVVSAETPR
jgi:hypothetical protein